MKKRIFTLIIMAFNAQFVIAGDQVGRILNLNVRADGLHWVSLEGSHNNKPGCASQNYWVIKDENSVAGKTQLSFLLSAWAAGRAISIIGLNTCTRDSGAEDINMASVTQ